MRSPRSFASRTGVLAVLGTVVLAACGSSEPATQADPAPAATDAAASPTFATNESTEELAVDAPGSTEPVPAGGQTGDEPAAEEPAAEQPAAEQPDGTDAPAAEQPAEVQAAVLGGRALPETVDPAAEVETNLLPSVVVDDVGRGAKADWRNIFPADRPVLLWLWAPH